MRTFEILFWILFFGIFYAYVGYGMLIWILVKLKNKFSKKQHFDSNFLPSVTLLVAAYNEETCVEQKIINSLALNYPKELLKIVFVTDGSTDKTNEIIAKYPSIQLFHQSERRGKMAAINRIMPLINTKITVFSDANAMLNKEAIRAIVNHFANEKNGVVAGEKRVSNQSNNTTDLSEGMYWQYESFLKNLDAQLYSCVGAAGELYAIRTELFEELEADTILDDFMLSLRICEKNYTIAYEPNAYASETASADTKEELKRKIRICAGGFQSVFRLKDLLNPFKHGVLSFQYISHRVLRWFFVPFALILLLILNVLLMQETIFYQIFLFAQLTFYTMAILGYLFEKAGKKAKIFYLPYYFSVMNYAALAGFKRFLKNQQSVVWEKAIRA